mgnify:CR=1 FL=1|jgi:hypothetical protein
METTNKIKNWLKEPIHIVGVIGISIGLFTIYLAQKK